jgi:hypothetical protein
MHFGFIQARNHIRSSVSQPKQMAICTGTPHNYLIQLLYRAIILSDNYRLSLPIGSFIVGTSYTRTTAHMRIGKWQTSVSDTTRTLSGAALTPSPVGLQQLNVTSCHRCIDRGGNCYIPYLDTPRRDEGRWPRLAGNSPRRTNRAGNYRTNCCLSSWIRKVKSLNSSLNSRSPVCSSISRDSYSNLTLSSSPFLSRYWVTQTSLVLFSTRKGES